jgi:hypothetical protein
MRAILILVVALFVVDAMLFDGNFRRASYNEAKYQGQAATRTVQTWLQSFF